METIDALSEVGSRKSEDGSPKSEVGSRKSEARRCKHYYINN